MGSLAALAVGVGIYVATRGKKGGSAAVEAASITPSSTSAPKVKNIFEKQGLKVEKGKILNTDGTGYTGVIKTELNKNGQRFEIEYKDGIIQKSTKFNGDECISAKQYCYDDKGQLDSVNLLDKDGNYKDFALCVMRSVGAVTYMPKSTGLQIKKMKHNNSIVEISKKVGENWHCKYYKNGKLIAEQLLDKNFTFRVLRPDGMVHLEKGLTTIKEFDNKGKLIGEYNIFDDKYDTCKKIIKSIRGF